MFTDFKLSEFPKNTLIESETKGQEGLFLRADTALGEPYWEFLEYHCVDCADDKNLTLEEADEQITEFKLVSIPLLVAEFMNEEFAKMTGSGILLEESIKRVKEFEEI